MLYHTHNYYVFASSLSSSYPLGDNPISAFHSKICHGVSSAGCAVQVCLSTTPTVLAHQHSSPFVFRVNRASVTSVWMRVPCVQELQAFFPPLPEGMWLIPGVDQQSFQSATVWDISHFSTHCSRSKEVHARVELRFQVYRESERGREQHVTLSMLIRVKGEWPQTARPGFAFTVA